MRREAPLAAGDLCNISPHSLFVDREGRLHLACLHHMIRAGRGGELLLGHDWSAAAANVLVPGPATLVPSMQDTRIVSVAASDRHCLALSAEGEVYSWGDRGYGVLGHADGSARAGPTKIETLACVESIAAETLAITAVDDRGRLFTWGRARWENAPTGLGYELDPETECQLTPKRVDVLSPHRVVGVDFGACFTLAVTDAGAVFSFGSSYHGALGHGLSTSEVLPQPIQALAETGRRFVAEAAGRTHALSLTEEGQLYAWGDELANGHEHGQYQTTPQLVTALAGEHARRVYAYDFSLCAITQNGELYTWGSGIPDSFGLGHGVAASQLTPKRVEALRHVKVAAAAVCYTHTLVAGEDGIVWVFEERSAVGLCGVDAPPGYRDGQPIPIPNLRVRILP